MVGSFFDFSVTELLDNISGSSQDGLMKAWAKATGLPEERDPEIVKRQIKNWMVAQSLQSLKDKVLVHIPENTTNMEKLKQYRTNIHKKSTDLIDKLILIDMVHKEEAEKALQNALNNIQTAGNVK